MKKNILVVEISRLTLFTNLNDLENKPFKVKTTTSFEDEDPADYDLVLVDPEGLAENEDRQQELLQFLEYAHADSRVIIYSNLSEHECQLEYGIICLMHYDHYVCKTQNADVANKYVPMEEIIGYVETLVA